MRKLLTQLIKAIPLILLMLAFTGVNAQRRYSPLSATGPSDFVLTLRNDVQVDCKNMTFDVYIYDADNTEPFEMASVQVGVIVNSLLYNGGTITMTIVPGSSGLQSNMIPTSVIWVQTQNCIKLTPKSPPGAGSGFILPYTSPGVRVCTLKMTNTANFGQVPVNETVCFTTVPYPTKVAQYIGVTNTQITCSTANCYPVLANPTMTCGSPPISYPVTIVGSNPYCEGQTAPNISLSNSQTGVNYQLWKGITAIGGAIAGNDGSALSPAAWQGMTAGSYTIVGTNGLGSVTMNTGVAVTVSMNPLPVAAGTITGPTHVCILGTGFVYSVPAITNATSYNWTIPTGFSITSTTGNSITVTATGSAVSGNFTVKGVNACGNGTVSANYGVTVDPLPVAAGSITGPSAVCILGTGFVYSVPAITNATSYNWTIPTGFSITSTTGNSITVTATGSAVSGDFSVYGVNACGNGTASANYGVTVNPLPVAAGVILGTQYVVQGTPNVAYSVPPITNASTYVWAYSGNGATFNGSGSSITISFSASATSGVVSVHGSNSCGVGADSYFNVTLESTNFQWTGTIDHDWFNGENWNSHYVPGTGNDIVIPHVTNLPVISGAMVAVCGAVVINDQASITVNGKFSPSGTTTVAGNLGLIINDGGSYIDNGIAGSGTEQVKKTFSTAKWHYMSSPISDAVTGLFTGDWLCQYYSQYLIGWTPYSYYISNIIPLNPEQGYAAYVNVLHTTAKLFTGHLNTNAAPYSCITQQYPVGTGYNLVGNAYPSAIDLANTNITWPSATHTAYFWDPNMERYDVYNKVDAPYVHSQYAPAIQGFFIEAPVAGNFQVPNSARVHNGELFLKDAGNSQNILQLSATSEANGKVDQAIVGFIPGTTTGYDANYDAAKLAGGSETPQIYSLLSDNQKVAFDILPSMNECPVVPMGFTCGVNGTFNLNASNIESFDASAKIYLEDLQAGIIQDLKANPAYTFNYTTGDAANRFVLHFSGPTGINDQQANGVQVYTYESSLYVRNLDNQSLKNVFVYDLLGKEVFHSALNQSPLQKFVLSVNQGYYVVKVVSATGVTTRKVYID